MGRAAAPLGKVFDCDAEDPGLRQPNQRVGADILLFAQRNLNIDVTAGGGRRQDF